MTMTVRSEPSKLFVSTESSSASATYGIRVTVNWSMLPLQVELLLQTKHWDATLGNHASCLLNYREIRTGAYLTEGNGAGGSFGSFRSFLLQSLVRSNKQTPGMSTWVTGRPSLVAALADPSGICQSISIHLLSGTWQVIPRLQFRARAAVVSCWKCLKFDTFHCSPHPTEGTAAAKTIKRHSASVLLLCEDCFSPVLTRNTSAFKWATFDRFELCTMRLVDAWGIFTARQKRSDTRALPQGSYPCMKRSGSFDNHVHINGPRHR